MPSSDGFSIKTTIAQLGQVARTQLKASQNAAAATPHGAEKVQEDQRPDKVKKPEESEKTRTDPDRRRRREQEASSREETPEEQNEEQAPVGRRLDIKA